MTEKICSLRLADELAGNQLYGLQRRCRDEAAAELRRLHAENEANERNLCQLTDELAKAIALLRQALEALETDDWQKKLMAAIDIRNHTSPKGAT